MGEETETGLPQWYAGASGACISAHTHIHIFMHAHTHMHAHARTCTHMHTHIMG